jgi:acetyl-CoA hydrolase
MDWSTQYQSRVVTAQEAVRAIKSGDRVFMTGNVSVPQKLLPALVEYAPNLTNVEICQALSVGPAEYVNPESSTGGSCRFYACISLRVSVTV